MTSEKPALPAYLDNIRIILTRTSHPANIGSAARAMKTMGLHKLTIVAPNLMATPMTENPPVFDPSIRNRLNYRKKVSSSLPARQTFWKMQPLPLLWTKPLPTPPSPAP